VRIVCPYTPDKLELATVAALRALDHPVEMADVSLDDRTYSDLLEALWDCDQDFCLIEHDIIVDIDAIDAMASCPQWWCANAYAVNHQVGEVITGLGCTRFRSELCHAVPDAVVLAGRRHGGYPRRHWAKVDARLAQVLNSAGYVVHRHHPDVGHLHLA
jgi:hypothetical protein